MIDLEDEDSLAPPPAAAPDALVDALDAPPAPRLQRPGPAEVRLPVRPQTTIGDDDALDAPPGPALPPAPPAGRSVRPVEAAPPEPVVEPPPAKAGRALVAALGLGAAAVAVGALAWSFAPGGEPARVEVVPPPVAVAEPAPATAAAVDAPPPAPAVPAPVEAATAPAPAVRAATRPRGDAPRRAPTVASPPSSPPAPAPEPEPPATGVLRVEHRDDFPIELRSGGRTASPGAVRAGSWQVWADFGDGLQPRTTVEVGAGETVVVRCSQLGQTCVKR